jgi:hypothetical protein
MCCSGSLSEIVRHSTNITWYDYIVTHLRKNVDPRNLYREMAFPPEAASPQIVNDVICLNQLVRQGWAIKGFLSK